MPFQPYSGHLVVAGSLVADHIKIYDLSAADVHDRHERIGLAEWGQGFVVRVGTKEGTLILSRLQIATTMKGIWLRTHLANVSPSLASTAPSSSLQRMPRYRKDCIHALCLIH